MDISTNGKFMFLKNPYFYEITIPVRLTAGTVISTKVGNDFSNERICRTI